MSFTIYLTRDFDQMSRVAADVVEADIRDKQAVKDEYLLGLAAGATPAGLYRHLAEACNAGRVDPSRIRSFNLDEYVGLPGDDPRQRASHPQSFASFMRSRLFSLLHRQFREASMPLATLVDQAELGEALDRDRQWYRLLGTGGGRAIVIAESAGGVLGVLNREVLDAYEKKIIAAGGIDLQVVGVGGRGHVAFHESGIPFDASPVLLVRLDDNTVGNAVADGHFASVDASPRYAVSMSAELVYRARAVVLLASGARKAQPVRESILGEVTCDVPVSYGQTFVRSGGRLVYVLDEAAGAGVLARRGEVAERGYHLVDLRDQP